MTSSPLLNRDQFVQELDGCQALAARLYQASMAELLATRPEREIDYKFWGGMCEYAQSLAAISAHLAKALSRPSSQA